MGLKRSLHNEIRLEMARQLQYAIDTETYTVRVILDFAYSVSIMTAPDEYELGYM